MYFRCQNDAQHTNKLLTDWSLSRMIHKQFTLQFGSFAEDLVVILSFKNKLLRGCGNRAGLDAADCVTDGYVTFGVDRISVLTLVAGNRVDVSEVATGYGASAGEEPCNGVADGDGGEETTGNAMVRSRNADVCVDESRQRLTQVLTSVDACTCNLIKIGQRPCVSSLSRSVHRQTLALFF